MLDRDGLVLSDDPAMIDVGLVHHWLSESSYWASGRSLDTVRRSIANSHCIGVYENGSQIGFTRVVSDEATFAWVCDVFVHEERRGAGIGRWMVGEAVEWCNEVGILRITLGTRDAHGVYEGVGFAPLAKPERWMEIDHRAKF
jgi:GNAT superfamily N-acetyltransferase